MRIIIIATILCIIFFSACNGSVNSYENNLGVKPSSLATIDTPNYTTIKWGDTVKNFGTVNEGAPLKIDFKFKNTGKTILYILETLPSCGCIVSNYPANPILPEEDGIVTATVNTFGQSGSLRKNILVKTNTKNQILHRVEFYGEIIKTANK